MGTFRWCESNDPVCKQAAVGDCQLVNIELWGGGDGGPQGLPSQMVVFFRLDRTRFPTPTCADDARRQTIVALHVRVCIRALAFASPEAIPQRA